ncbi:MaoC like domain [Klebsiella michiganensis]|uniref:MaoC like domain n=1 Tax=Klebsiella michiganensis TaxID=1134687 RepID=A0A7H4MT72_9ENTR|nr:MaoC like domain [Klebsiella michiganensis]
MRDAAALHLADAQQWAAFSGDENPIHFDLAAARQMGAGQLSVHGMRALLDVKRDAHSRLYRPERYVKCQVRLRRPIWCDTDWLLNARASQKSPFVRQHSVSNPQNGELCLSCQMSTAAEPESLVGKQPCTIGAKDAARAAVLLQRRPGPAWRSGSFLMPCCSAS